MSWVSSMGGGGWGAQLEAEGWRKGPWTAEEDKLLTEHVSLHGEGRWNSVAMLTGLKRNGKSCRLRWVNYLRPDLKRGQITPHEENIILELHARWGNRWSSIARSLPGRTDNEIKNYWRTHFKKKAKTPPATSEKAKSRVLKRHHFQQQQLQPQQQQVHLNQVDIERIMSMLDEMDHDRIPYVQREDQVGPTCYTDLSGSNNDMPSISEASTKEDFLWDELWNLDDFHGGASFGVCCTSSNACVQN